MKLLVLTVFFFLIACHEPNKLKPNNSDIESVEDFINIFPTKTLPYSITDSLLSVNEKANNQLKNETIAKFLADSVLRININKTSKIKMYALGKVIIPKEATYLFLKSVTDLKKIIWIAAFDKEDKFICAMPVTFNLETPNQQESLVMDKRQTITKLVTRKNKNGINSEGKDVYSLNEAAAKFSLILIDAFDEKDVDVVNPIDTLQHKNKLSADYTKDKKNIISIRDSKSNNKISFFIHFEKNNGECTGELKGEALVTSANTAIYQQNEDPCQLQFNFTSTQVTLKEINACGSHRSPNCPFEGSFERRKFIQKKQATTNIISTMKPKKNK